MEAETANPMVTLVSNDGFRFVLPRTTAEGSGFIKDNLSSGFTESDTNVIRIDERAEIVDKVAEYLMYKAHYTNSKEEIPDFKDRVKPEIALELLMASDFMNC